MHLMGVVLGIACSAGRVGGPPSQPLVASGCASVNNAARFRSAKIDELEGAIVGRTSQTCAMKENQVMEMMWGLLLPRATAGGVAAVGCAGGCGAVRAQRARSRRPIASAMLLASCSRDCTSTRTSRVGGRLDGCLRGACARWCALLLGRRVLRCCWSGRPPGHKCE